MRFVIAGLLLVHGLIHLMGFFKPASRVSGVPWLAVTLLLVAAAALCLFERDAWWIPAAIGVLASQGLILSQWSEAKAGTVLNVLLLIPILIGFSIARFRRDDEARTRELLATASKAAPSIVTAQELATLPAPVRRWLEVSGVVGKPRAKTVQLIQRGELRTSPDAKFMHAAATQHFTLEQPGFVWKVDVTMWGLPIVGRDQYLEGRARMLIKLGGLITVADGTGEKFDQGTLLRFLGEICWFPSAALAPYISWEAMDERHARATITWSGTKASAVFEFDDRGRLLGLSAQRYFNGQTLEEWRIPITEWKVVRGVEMPTRGGAVWKLAAGDFDYYQWEIIDVIPNP